MSILSDSQVRYITLKDISACFHPSFHVALTASVRDSWHWRVCKGAGRAARGTACWSHSWLSTEKCWTSRRLGDNWHQRGRGCPPGPGQCRHCPGACWSPPWAASWSWSWGRRWAGSCSEAAWSGPGRYSDSEYNFIKISALITIGPGKLNGGSTNTTKECIVWIRVVYVEHLVLLVHRHLFEYLFTSVSESSARARIHFSKFSDSTWKRG